MQVARFGGIFAGSAALGNIGIIRSVGHFDRIQYSIEQARSWKMQARERSDFEAYSSDNVGAGLLLERLEEMAIRNGGREFEEDKFTFGPQNSPFD